MTIDHNGLIRKIEKALQSFKENPHFSAFSLFIVALSVYTIFGYIYFYQQSTDAENSLSIIRSMREAVSSEYHRFENEEKAYSSFISDISNEIASTRSELIDFESIYISNEIDQIETLLNRIGYLDRRIESDDIFQELINTKYEFITKYVTSNYVILSSKKFHLTNKILNISNQIALKTSPWQNIIVSVKSYNQYDNEKKIDEIKYKTIISQDRINLILSAINYCLKYSILGTKHSKEITSTCISILKNYNPKKNSYLGPIVSNALMLLCLKGAPVDLSNKLPIEIFNNITGEESTNLYNALIEDIQKVMNQDTIKNRLSHYARIVIVFRGYVNPNITMREVALEDLIP